MKITVVGTGYVGLSLAILLSVNHDVIAYDIDFEKPCFFVNNHFISPILRCYSATLPNPVSLEKCDEIKVNIKIPKISINVIFSLKRYFEDM